MSFYVTVVVDCCYAALRIVSRLLSWLLMSMRITPRHEELLLATRRRFDAGAVYDAT